MPCFIHTRLLFRPLVATSPTRFACAVPHSFTPSRYSSLLMYAHPHMVLSTPPPSHVCASSSSRQAAYGDEHCPYVTLAHRYALVVVFNEYKSVRSTTTTAAMMTAAGGNSEFIDLVTTARINVLRLVFFSFREIDNEENTGRCKLMYSIMNIFFYFAINNTNVIQHRVSTVRS